MNSVFSLSYKISFANLRSLFIDHITYTGYGKMWEEVMKEEERECEKRNKS